jgi:oligopeptide transport system substrate-binding protein
MKNKLSKHIHNLKRGVAALLSVSLTLLLIPALSACSAGDGSDYAFSYSLTAEPKNLDPQVASDNNSLLVIKNTFEGLMRIGPDGTMINGVAESYDSNAAYTEYTFNLRTDAKWSDGSPVTAYDFEFALRRAVDPMTKSTTASSLFCIKNAAKIFAGEMETDTLGVTAIDAYTLKITLEYAFAEFPLQTTLAQYMPCNQNYFVQTQGHYALDAKYIITNGPFTFNEKSWSHGNYVRLIRNEFYKGENTVAPRILYLGIRKSSTDYFELLDKGTVESAAIETKNVSKLEDSGFNTITYSDRTWGLLFNTEKTGLTNKTVRRAIVSCLDTEDYTKMLPANMIPAYDIIPPATTLNGHLYRSIAGEGFKLKSNREGAADLMTLGLRELKRKSLPSVTITCPNDEETVAMMQYLLQSWQSYMLVYFNIDPVDIETLENRVNIGDYQIALCALQPSKDGPVTCLNMFKSTTYQNLAQLNDVAFDMLLEQASAKTNTEDIIAPIVAAEKYLNENAIFYPMYYETRYYATLKGVSGIYFSPFDGTADFTCAKYKG